MLHAHTRDPFTRFPKSARALPALLRNHLNRGLEFERLSPSANGFGVADSGELEFGGERT